MAAISHVTTIRYVAEQLREDEELLWELADDMEPEDGKIWVIHRPGDDDGAQSLAFTTDGIERLQELLAERQSQN